MTEKKQHAPRRISPTSLDVAREAGVSQAAVSYALNGVSQAHVSDETRAKILQAARKLGYHAHPSARSLRKGQSDEICCIIDAPSTLLAYEIHISIMQQIFQHGYIPVFYVSPSVPTGQWRETLRQPRCSNWAVARDAPGNFRSSSDGSHYEPVHGYGR